MKLVRLIKNYKNRPILRQTPRNAGIWEDIRFTLDPVDSCDYVVVLNSPMKNTAVKCPPEHIWAIIGEPPVDEFYKRLQKSSSSCKRVYTCDETLKGARYIYSHPAIPWEVEKDYDFLLNCAIPRKARILSTITSDKTIFQGHRMRLEFLGKLKGKIDFDRFGRGTNDVRDKWDGLAPYKYSIAIENFSNPYYWTEKIADCFLAWTMPIYFGCQRITEYFPKEAVFCIDLHDPFAADKIREAIENDLWEHSLDAITHARELVLKKHQLFPMIAAEIKNNEDRSRRKPSQCRKIVIHSTLHPPRSLTWKMRQFFASFRRVAAANNTLREKKTEKRLAPPEMRTQTMPLR